MELEGIMNRVICENLEKKFRAVFEKSLLNSLKLMVLVMVLLESGTKSVYKHCVKNEEE